MNNFVNALGIRWNLLSYALNRLICFGALIKLIREWGNYVKKKILLLIISLIITGCGNSSNQDESTDSVKEMEEISSDKDISKDSLSKTIEDVIQKFKSNGVPIQYTIIYTDETDPNGSGNHDYLKKGNFSDSSIESDYDKQEPLSGTIEIFDNNENAKQRAEYLKNLKSNEATDNFPYRIVSENILLRLSNKYSEEQIKQFVEIMGGELLLEEAESEINLDDYPTVTYDDISTGKYNGQTVCIDAIIDRINKPSKSILDFALWLPSEETYIYDGSCQLPYEVDETIKSIFENANNGDVIKYATQIYEDGSFGITGVIGAKVIGQQNLDEVYTEYKENCTDINYEDMQRNPSNYSGTSCKISGTVFQIVNEASSRAEYLISTDSGYVYATWYDNSSARGSRFLENDNVLIYGTFSTLKTYDTLIDQKTVPEISVTIMELNQ